MFRGLTLLVLAFLPALACTAPVPVYPKTDDKKELERLAGTWEVTSYIQHGQELVNQLPRLTITFRADGDFEFSNDINGKIIAINPNKKLKEVDYVYLDEYCEVITDDNDKPEVSRAIYKLDGDTFTDCFAESGGEARPTEFKSTKENGWTVVVYKRIKNQD